MSGKAELTWYKGWERCQAEPGVSTTQEDAGGLAGRAFGAALLVPGGMLKQEAPPPHHSPAPKHPAVQDALS